jgi:hypothetical protein
MIIAVGDLPEADMGMNNQDVIVMDNENEHNGGDDSET